MNSISFSLIIKTRGTTSDIRYVTAVIKRYYADIERINFDRDLDPNIVFFQIKTDRNSYREIYNTLEKSGYLLTSIKEPEFIRLKIFIPERSRIISEILTEADDHGIDIKSIDHNRLGQNRNEVSLTVSTTENQPVIKFIDSLKSRFKVEIEEYCKKGNELDKTVFYVRYAERLSKYLNSGGDIFLLSFLNDINNIAHELNKLGENPETVFEKIYSKAETLHNTTGRNFYADYQQFKLKNSSELYIYQLPCGGNINIIESEDEYLMIDTGYGIYHDDITRMLNYIQPGLKNKRKSLFISHADADHCGGGGYHSSLPVMHNTTMEIIQKGNRAIGSVNENSILEEIYTTLIAEFSGWNPPQGADTSCFTNHKGAAEKAGEFPVTGELCRCGLEFRILESHGGHQKGQLFLLEESEGLLFTFDSLLNLKSITKERTEYNMFADYLMTTVNVDSSLAKKERKDLLDLAVSCSRKYRERNNGDFLICCGHGAVSVINEKGRLEEASPVKHYTHASV